MCNAEGCPVSIEVFEGNTADPNTLNAQIDKLRCRFGVTRVVLVGDRGMITSRSIDESLRDVVGLDWIGVLRADTIKRLASEGPIEPSLFDERDLAEAALGGLYVIRTSHADVAMSPGSTVRAHKDLAKVERAFRCMKTVDLRVRPIHHWRDRRIKAHVFLCMLAYYLGSHLRLCWAPIFFDDHDRQAADAARSSVVAPAERFEAAK